MEPINKYLKRERKEKKKSPGTRLQCFLVFFFNLFVLFFCFRSFMSLTLLPYSFNVSLWFFVCFILNIYFKYSQREKKAVDSFLGVDALNVYNS